jgi:hypothetical protein
VIAKLDRLSPDAHFLLGLQKAGVKFVATDMPEANEMVVGIMDCQWVTAGFFLANSPWLPEPPHRSRPLAP